MTFKQGVAFRSTSGYVTDGASDWFSPGLVGSATYPLTTTQGNTAGWTGSSQGGVRDRSTSVDPRIAGTFFLSSSLTNTFRIDLPSAGTYRIRCACGDYSSAGNTKLEVFDNATSLGTLTNGTSHAAGHYIDATGVDRTAAAWPGSNAYVDLTFGSTIARFTFSSATGNSNIAYLSIEDVASGNSVSVPAGSLTLTGFVPTVSATASNAVAVPAGSLSLTGNAPTVTVGNAQTVAVPAGALTLTGNAPTVVTTANQTIAVPAGSLSLTGNAPTVVVGDQQIVLVPAGVLNITGFAPVVIAGGPVVVSVPAGSLSLTGYAPTVDTGGRRNNAAGKAKRRKYEIQGKTYALTPGELEQVLSLVMREDEPEEEAPKVVVKAVKEVAKAVAAVPVEAPTYEANPAFDALWADMTRQHEHEAAESLRVIAQQIHEKAIFDDDQDILDIIALIP